MAWKLITALLLVPNVLAVPAPDGSLCVKTVPENCTLTFIGDIGSAKTYGQQKSWWRIAQIYDNTCKLIGSRERREPTFEALTGIVPFSIDSALRWTTDVKRLNFYGDYNSISFRYGAYSYDGAFDCLLIGDYLSDKAGAKNNVCRHQFPCK
ncbi:hypothetical protein PFICI_03465 [Pestalotiopsis fici W106-1]|uniref:DUF1036 domain-containing protein n=1 Tax=Pestalotiopsis fici (strain W106-1 / CGMCC3.15140) TaxID=1229662 RepID=W3XHC8_PESFW|nr:uncharacterized protein PFICI_03465 [Pestalotiopsis fici W106-1]ETS85440.1 hypothetical protein PFICI_03465 [Pestalotiopsis fici W106-1]